MTNVTKAEYQAIHRIADALSPQMRRDFLAAIKALRAKLDLGALEELLARGDQGQLGAFWRAYEQDVAIELRPALREAFFGAATRTARGFGLAFDITNPRAVNAIETHAATLVQQVTQASQLAIRATIRSGFTDGLTIPEMAQRIRSSIGLTDRYVQAVENYRSAQEAAGISANVVANRAESYATRLLNLRADTIARTETLAAANRGQQAVWEEASAQGLLDGGQRRQWIITPDDRLCEICEAIPDLNPDGVGLQEPFQTDVGPVMTPPAHVSCRCAVGLVVTEAA